MPVLWLQVNSGLSLPIDEVAPGDVDSNGEPIDAKLYTTFWGLQNVFKVLAGYSLGWSRFRFHDTKATKASHNLAGARPASCKHKKEHKKGESEEVN